MYPWIHLHTSPTGTAAPCCIAASCATPEGMGNARNQTLMELVNSEQMKKLRLDMINGNKNPECDRCYKHEEQGIKSSRQHVNEQFAKSFDTVIPYTNLLDGSLYRFEMHYFDVRFNNICNFKCRTCGSGFSSQWEQEDLKNNVYNAKVLPKNNNKQFLQDVIDQIDYMQVAYFAGGEPLITEEHYILLEEMIRRKKTNIRLIYNTNISNLKYKNKDLIGLWGQFSNNIDIYASIDHYGPKAEYIRHGTNWSDIETNFSKLKNLSFINLQINTVLSIFNGLTIFDFYKYLIDNNLYTVKDRIYTLYNMSVPEHLSCHVLPLEYKQKVKESIDKTVELMRAKGFQKEKINQVADAGQWIFSKDSWEEQKYLFRSEVMRLDNIRKENFSKTFPELAPLLKEPRATTRPKVPV
jgi:hypothetical protein